MWLAGIIHTPPFNVLAEISSHDRNHWISSPIKLCNLWRNTSSGKVAMFVGLILHWEEVGGGTHPDTSFAQSQYSPYSHPHPSGIWLLALGHLDTPGVPQGLLLPSTPRSVGTGGCRGAWLIRAPSLACALVLPGPLSVVSSWNNRSTASCHR